MEFTCPFCDRAVSPTDPTGWQRIIDGWQRSAGVRPSGKHGGSDRVLVETGQEWAHDYCVGLAKSGVLNQGSLEGL